MENNRNDIQRYHGNYDNNDDEIDLYELVQILVKNRITIFVTAALVTALAFGGALYTRNNTKLKFAKDIAGIRTETFFIGKANLILEPVRLNELLEEPKIQREYMNNPELENFYKTTLGNNPDNYSARKEFLSNIVKIEEVTQDTLDNKKVIKNLAIVVELPKEQENLKEYLTEKYLELYERERNIQLEKALKEKYELVKNEAAKYEKELMIIGEEIRKIVANQPKEVLMGNTASNIIAIEHPILFQKKNERVELYARYSSELIGVEGALKEELNQKSIISLTPVYQIPVKSKAMLILAVGIVLGIFLGIFMAFIQEFIEGYRKREKK